MSLWWLITETLFGCFPDLSEHPGEGPTQELPLHQRKEQKRQSRPVVGAVAACTRHGSAPAVLSFGPDRCMDYGGLSSLCGLLVKMEGIRMQGFVS